MLNLVLNIAFVKQRVPLNPAAHPAQFTNASQKFIRSDLKGRELAWTQWGPV
jgi:hypothetical protein